MDVGGGLRYTHPGLGLSLGLKGRALVMHETAELAEWGASGWLAWDPNPASELGPALTVSPSFGAPLGRRRSGTVEQGDTGGAGGRSDGRDRCRAGRRQVRLWHAAGRRRWGAVGRYRTVGARARVPGGLRVPGRHPVGYRSSGRAGRQPAASPRTPSPQHTLSMQSTVSW